MKIGDYITAKSVYDDIPVTYRFIVALISQGRRVALIDLNNGNRWNEPIVVENIHQFNDREINQLTIGLTNVRIN